MLATANTATNPILGTSTNGSVATLEDVVEFYSEGGTPNPSLDSEIRPRKFTAEEKRALAAFLQSLTGHVSAGM